MRSETVTIGTSATEASFNTIRPGRRYALGVWQCDKTFTLHFAVPGVGFQPSDWAGGAEPDAAKIITAEFVAPSAGVKLVLSAAPAAEVTAWIQEVVQTNG